MGIMEKNDTSHFEKMECMLAPQCFSIFCNAVSFYSMQHDLWIHLKKIQGELYNRVICKTSRLGGENGPVSA